MSNDTWHLLNAIDPIVGYDDDLANTPVRLSELPPDHSLLTHRCGLCGLPAMPTHTIANCREMAALRAEVVRLRDLLDRDRTGLATALDGVVKLCNGYDWATVGRGPYAWNDDEYRAEFARALQAIHRVASDGLSASGTLANQALKVNPEVNRAEGHERELVVPGHRSQHDPPIEGESNVDHARHCNRCQDDARNGPVKLRTEH